MVQGWRRVNFELTWSAISFYMFAHKVQNAIGALSSSLKGNNFLLKSLFFVVKEHVDFH